jgi:AcrR family transcriptional regulator
VAGQVKPRRPYRSDRRREQAAATREEILAAAEELFSTRGYAAASVEEIARRSGVAAATVYAAGGKRALLQELITHVVTAGRGGDPVGVDREGPTVADLDDIDAIIHLHVSNIRALKERGWRAHSLLWRAAQSDPDAAVVWTRFQEVMQRGQEDLTWRLFELGMLRKDLDPPQAARVFAMMVRPEAFEWLTVDAGWDLDRWQGFIEDAAKRLLLP